MSVEQQEPDWADPVAALAEFEPPADYYAGGGDALPAYEQRVRYGFRVGGIGLLIEANSNSEVVEPLPVSALPNSPRWLRGLINLRGNLVPVFDLVELLGLSSAAAAQSRMLILDRGERAVGLLVDALPEAPSLERRLRRPPPLPALLAGHVSAAYVNNDFVWLDFNHTGFFQAMTRQFSV